MNQAGYSREEIAARGEAIYELQIRPHVEGEYRGKYLVMDIESGDYEVDAEDLLATKRVLERRPKGVLYGLRIGYPAAYHLGGFRKASQGFLRERHPSQSDLSLPSCG